MKAPPRKLFMLRRPRSDQETQLIFPLLLVLLTPDILHETG